MFHYQIVLYRSRSFIRIGIKGGVQSASLHQDIYNEFLIKHGLPQSKGITHLVSREVDAMLIEVELAFLSSFELLLGTIARERLLARRWLKKL